MNRYIKRSLVFTVPEIIKALGLLLESQSQACPMNKDINIELTLEDKGRLRLEWETEEENLDLTK